MDNLKNDLIEIDELINNIVGSVDVGNRYIFGKKLKDKIDFMLMKAISQENDLVNIQLKKIKKS